MYCPAHAPYEAAPLHWEAAAQCCTALSPPPVHHEIHRVPPKSYTISLQSHRVHTSLNLSSHPCHPLPVNKKLFHPIGRKRLPRYHLNSRQATHQRVTCAADRPPCRLRGDLLFSFCRSSSQGAVLFEKTRQLLPIHAILIYSLLYKRKYIFASDRMCKNEYGMYNAIG